MTDKDDTATITFRTSKKNKAKGQKHARARGISLSQLCDELLELLPEEPAQQPKLTINYAQPNDEVAIRQQHYEDYMKRKRGESDRT